MKYQTGIGGTNEQFQDTGWTQILSVRTDDDKARGRAAIEQIFKRYWKPVYCYLRHKGYGNERAKDLTQGFFTSILEGKLIEKADRAKGKFRSFLLTALDNYVAGVHRAETAKKRRPPRGLLPLDASDSSNTADPAMTATPHEAFTHAWASTLLDEVLFNVKLVCGQRGRKKHWLVFNARVVMPILEDVQPPSLSELCRRYKVSNVGKASNMIVTVKRRFQRALQTRVRQLVARDAQVAQEIQDLIKILSISRAGT